MEKSPHLSVPTPAATAAITGSAKRRSTRIPPRPEEEDTGNAFNIGVVLDPNRSPKNYGETNSSDGSSSSSSSPEEGWKHPAELQYLCRSDWSKDLIMTYLCQKAFTVPPRLTSSFIPYTTITRSFLNEQINIPRGYRIPLMFVAKFQWDSLRLVLNNDSEWEEYKFDIVHLTRLCTHFFKQARAAAAANELSKTWRSPMFDRVLIRFYRKWMVSREWSVKKFWEEFDEDEYTLDVLKFDWARWAMRGHKGFVLTKEEVVNGITADQFKQGLRKKPDGTWTWGGDNLGTQDASLGALNSPTLAALEAITNATHSHNSLEVKHELLDKNNEGLDLNKNGKRPRGDDAGGPRKVVRRSNIGKAPIPLRRKVIANTAGVSAPGGERPENSEGTQPNDVTTMGKGSVSQPFIFTNGLKTIPSHAPKRKAVSANKVQKQPTASSSKTAAIPIDASSSQKLDPTRPLLPPAGDFAMAQAPKIPNRENLFHILSNAIRDAISTVPLLSTAPGNSGEGIVHKASPDITSSAQIASGSSSLVPGNSAVSADSQASNPLSATAELQTDKAGDPKIVPNADASDDLTRAEPSKPELTAGEELTDWIKVVRMLNLSQQITDPSSSWPALPASPPPALSLPGSHPMTPPASGSTPLILTPNINLSTSPACPLIPNVDEGARISGSGLVEIGEERNMAEDSIEVPLEPLLSQSEQSVRPMNLISEVSEVETIVVGVQSVVEKVDVEEKADVEKDGTGTGVANGGDVAMVFAGDSEAQKAEVREGGEEMVDEPEVMDILNESVDDTNEVDVRMEKCVLEAQPVQPIQETPVDGVDVAMEKGTVDIQPVHTQSRQETPIMNLTDGVGIALEVGTVEGQSLNPRPFMETPTALPLNDSKAVLQPVPEGVPSHTHPELQSGDSREVGLTHADDLEDKMNVDEDIIQPIQPTPPPPTDGSLATNMLCIPPLMRTKSLHSIQLLQGLIQFLRMPAQDRKPKLSRTLENDLEFLKSQGTCPASGQARFPLSLGPYSSTEEVLSVDQRLDVLAHVSVTLAKNLYPYRGKELESKLDLLDKGLQHQLEMIQKLDGRTYGEMDGPFKELGAHSDEEFDRNTASMSTETISQGVQTTLPPLINRQFESVEVQTEAKVEAPASRPLSPDATMVDLTVPMPTPQEPSSPLAEKGDPQPDNNPLVAKTVMLMMRNMADLLDFTTQGSSQGSVRSLKGKEKEAIDADIMPSRLASPASTTMLEEFKSMKEEMRRSQQRNQSEVESMRLSHFMEVEALKDEIRNIEGRGKQELDEVTRRYSQQIGELKANIRRREEKERVREREKEGGSETKLPSLELLEIRRRLASLETRSRSDSISADMIRSASRSSMTNGHFSEPVVTRHPNYPPHLIPTDFEEHPYTSTFRAPRQFTREGSMSKPGTPVPSDRNHFSTRHPDVMDLDESMPLPAKSQRKMHMMNFPRPPIG